MTGSAGDILITMGDPAGVGPEIICKALAHYSPAERARMRVVGSIDVMRRAQAVTGADIRFSREAEPDAVRIEQIDIDGPIPAFGTLSLRPPLV